MRMSRLAEKWQSYRISKSRRTIFVLTSVRLMFFRWFLILSLYELDVFFGGDWHRELVVRGMHVRTVFRFYFFMWYGLYLVGGTVR